MMANIRDFQYVMEIARCSSISKAADALYISQPTLTKFLQRMEHELGMPLFHRVGKRFMPTPAGKIFIAKAEGILRLNGQMEQELQDLAAARNGFLRVGTTAGRLDYMIGTVLPEFKRAYPGIRVQLDMCHSHTLWEMVSNCELDIALANFDEEQPAVECTIISEDELVLVVRDDSALIGCAVEKEGFRFPVISTELWRNEHFVLPSSGSRSYRLVSNLFDMLHVEPVISAEIAGIQGVIKAVQAGLGISMYACVPLPAGSGITYLSIDCKELPGEKTAVFTRKGYYLSDPARAFIDLLKRTY